MGTETLNWFEVFWIYIAFNSFETDKERIGIWVKNIFALLLHLEKISYPF